MNTQQALDLARNLIKLAKDFNTNAAQEAAEIKRAFKAVASKNDLVRTTTYLMEVVGVRDAQYNQVTKENADLKELLKLNNINLEAVANDETTTTSEGSGSSTTVGSAEGTAAAGVQTASEA